MFIYLPNLLTFEIIFIDWEKFICIINLSKLETYNKSKNITWDNMQLIYIYEYIYKIFKVYIKIIIVLFYIYIYIYMKGI